MLDAEALRGGDVDRGDVVFAQAVLSFASRIDVSLGPYPKSSRRMPGRVSHLRARSSIIQ